MRKVLFDTEYETIHPETGGSIKVYVTGTFYPGTKDIITADPYNSVEGDGYEIEFSSVEIEAYDDESGEFLHAPIGSYDADEDEGLAEFICESCRE